MKMTCKKCREDFSTTDKRRRFCSVACYREWRKHQTGLGGVFSKGHKPWNKGSKGVMKANAGSFKRGQESDKKLPVGSKTIRCDKQGHRRRWIKVADIGTPYDWILCAVYVWEKYRGEIPTGSVMHHKDRDTLNDRLKNLNTLTRAEHLAEHRNEHDRNKRRTVPTPA